MQFELRSLFTPNPKPRMQSLCNLLIHHKVIPKSNVIFSLRSISSFQRPSSILNRGWEEETRALADPDRNPNPRLWRPFDSEGEPQVSTVYDPVQGDIVTEASQGERKPKESLKARDFMSKKKKMAKTRSSWVCDNCGAATGQWWGSCPSCHLAGTMKQFTESEVGSKARGSEVSEAAVRSWLPQKAGDSVPQSLRDVNKGRNQSEWRIPL